MLFLREFLNDSGGRKKFLALPHHAAKRDKNEALIVKALRDVGATVSRLSGPGLPDLLAGYAGRNHLLEVKSGSKLTPAQIEWIAEWKGSVAVVSTIDEALMAIGVRYADTSTHQ
jgi:hypothetical protein